MALRAYFDESGTHSGGPQASNTFVLCGYIATELLWDDKRPEGLVARWDSVMHGKPFHATEMESNPQGPDVKVMLANVVNYSGIIGIRGGISLPDFERLLAPLIRNKKGKPDPYFFLFADVISEAVKRSAMFIGENQDEPIGFVFADHVRWSVEALDLYRRLKADSDTPPEVARRMGSIAFDKIDRFIPLQAADHLAFESFHYMTDPPGTSRPAMNRLLDWPQNHGRFYREPELLQYIERATQEGIL